MLLGDNGWLRAWAETYTALGRELLVDDGLYLEVRPSPPRTSAAAFAPVALG